MTAAAFDLTGRLALVTGSTRGIGRTLAEGLSAAGATVVVHGRDLTAARREAEAITAATGTPALAIAFDVTDTAAIDTAFTALEAEHGALDVLVNNAGIQRRAPLTEFTDADWDDVRAADPGKHLRFGARTARWRLLDKRDLMRLVHGQKLLAAHTRAIGTDVFGPRCPRGSRGCTKARGDCWKYFQENAPNSMDDPLDVLNDCMRIDTLFSELPCASCMADIIVMAEKKRRELWRSLPAVFNLH